MADNNFINKENGKELGTDMDVQRVKWDLIGIIDNEIAKNLIEKLSFHPVRFKVSLAEYDKVEEKNIDEIKKRTKDEWYDSNRYHSLKNKIGEHKELWYQQMDKEPILSELVFDDFCGTGYDTEERHVIDYYESKVATKETILTKEGMLSGDYDSILKNISKQKEIGLNFMKACKGMIIGKTKDIINCNLINEGRDKIADPWDGISGLDYSKNSSLENAIKPFLECASWQDLAKFEENLEYCEKNSETLWKLTKGKRFLLRFYWIKPEDYQKLFEKEFDRNYFVKRIRKECMMHPLAFITGFHLYD